MARTTLNIDGPVLKELKMIQNREGKPLGRLVSELLASALAAKRGGEGGEPGLEWISKPMRSRIDLADKEALHAALDRER